VSQRQRVYAWEFPVRLTHWVNFLCIVAFAVTGIYIGSPYADAHSTSQYVMGWMRFLHFTAGYAFLMSFIIRLYWAFMGNRYASWKVCFPFAGECFEKLVRSTKHLLLIKHEPEHEVGHTALAGLTYLVVFLLFAFEIVSGFALYSLQQPGVWAASIGAWLPAVMDAQTIRLWHHVVMYLILAFAMAHVYIAWWHDTVERNGVMGSIFGGYKFMPRKESE
jgi:Ni/Fe-hydrogenase 1 B-type cytochrome subunit